MAGWISLWAPPALRGWEEEEEQEVSETWTRSSCTSQLFPRATSRCAAAGPLPGFRGRGGRPGDADGERAAPRPHGEAPLGPALLQPPPRTAPHGAAPPSHAPPASPLLRFRSPSASSRNSLPAPAAAAAPAAPAPGRAPARGCSPRPAPQSRLLPAAHRRPGTPSGYLRQGHGSLQPQQVSRAGMGRGLLGEDPADPPVPAVPTAGSWARRSRP